MSYLISTYPQPPILGKFHRLFSAELTYFLEIFNLWDDAVKIIYVDSFLKSCSY